MLDGKTRSPLEGLYQLSVCEIIGGISFFIFPFAYGMSGGILVRNWRRFANFRSREFLPARAQEIGTEIDHFTKVWVGAHSILLGFGFGTISVQAC